jgi:hypothetical protein
LVFRDWVRSRLPDCDPHHRFVGIVLDVEIDVRLGGQECLLARLTRHCRPENAACTIAPKAATPAAHTAIFAAFDADRETLSCSRSRSSAYLRRRRSSSALAEAVKRGLAIPLSTSSCRARSVYGEMSGSAVKKWICAPGRVRKIDRRLGLKSCLPISPFESRKVPRGSSRRSPPLLLDHEVEGSVDGMRDGGGSPHC